MEGVELILVGLLAAVAGLTVVSRRIGVPYPILLVVGGIALAFVPGIPEVRLDPELVLLVFLPPLLYSAAFFTSLRDLRANLRAISLLALGLVLATAAAVAVIGHVALGLSWPAAFVLGGVVSPTDPLAATAIARRLGVPARVVTIVEGESLVNDATALVIYRVAVAAVVTGSFSVADAGLRFVLAAVGGVAVGLACGWVVAWVRRRLDDPPVEVMVSLLTAYAAYVPAERIGASGVLAAVTVGVYMGWRAPELAGPATRMLGAALWEMLVFVANSVLFLLVGLQLPVILDAIDGRPAGDLIAGAALVSATVVAVRLLYVPTLTYLPGLRPIRDPGPNPGSVAIVAWTGMRGAVSLAAALAIPLTTDAGAPFPDRSYIVFLAFAVIVVTLVGQGLTLPALIRRLGVEEDGSARQEEELARVRAAEAALERIEELAGEPWANPDSVDRLRGLYRFRGRRFGEDGDGREAAQSRSLAYQRLRRELLAAERAALVRLRNEGHIGDEAMHRVERDLDLDDARLDL